MSEEKFTIVYIYLCLQVIHFQLSIPLITIH